MTTEIRAKITTKTNKIIMTEGTTETATGTTKERR